MTIFELLPADLRERAIPFLSIGSNSYAWNPQDALRVVEICRKHRLLILGGDVLRVNKDGIIRYTYDNWFFDITPVLPPETIVQSACDLAQTKIQHYSSLDEASVFDLVVKINPTQD